MPKNSREYIKTYTRGSNKNWFLGVSIFHLANTEVILRNYPSSRHDAATVAIIHITHHSISPESDI